MATRILKTLSDTKKTPTRVINPATTDKNLPAKRGSEKIFKKGIIVHINKGALPSDKGKKRRVGSDFMT